MPNYWILKTEPSVYSFADLEREGRTRWDGITAPAALLHLRGMQAGDRAFIYHTGDEKRIVGTATIARAAYPDPKAGDEKLVAVDVAVGKAVKKPVSLAEIKADSAFAELGLVRIPRLSVVPVPAAQWKRLVGMTGS